MDASIRGDSVVVVGEKTHSLVQGVRRLRFTVIAKVRLRISISAALREFEVATGAPNDGMIACEKSPDLKGFAKKRIGRRLIAAITLKRAEALQHEGNIVIPVSKALPINR